MKERRTYLESAVPIEVPFDRAIGVKTQDTVGETDRSYGCFQPQPQMNTIAVRKLEILEDER